MAQKYDVFISYSRKDYVNENGDIIPGNIVSQIKDALKAEGISYWFDEEGIPYGQDFVDKIVTNIDDSKIFLFLSTKNSNASKWTCKEIASAAGSHKRILPVRIDSSPYNKKVGFHIADLNHIDFYTNPEKRMKEICSTIKYYLGQMEIEKMREAEAKQRQENLKKQEEARIEEDRKRSQTIAEKEEQLASVRDKLYKIREQQRIAKLQYEQCKQEEKDLLNTIKYLKGVYYGETNTSDNRKRWISSVIIALVCIMLIGGGMYAYLHNANQPIDPMEPIEVAREFGEVDMTAHLAFRTDTMPMIKIINVCVEQNVVKDSILGMNVQLFMETVSAKGDTCDVGVLLSSDGINFTCDETGKRIYFRQSFVPHYELSEWNDFKIFFPYTALDDYTRGEYYLYIIIRGKHNESLSVAKWFPFTYDPLHVEKQ